MHILLVNDDGFDSPLLSILCEAAAARGHRVTVVAPHTPQSGKGHAFSGMQPLMGHPRSMPGAEQAWSVEGTPVDCSRLGFKKLCGEKPDLVISGVNNGYNAGMATYPSGTVGAAREAAFQRIPAVAVSMHDRTPAETLRLFADYAVRCGEKLVNYPAPELCVCNLNVPPIAPRELTRARMCGLSHITYRDDYEEYVSPTGQHSFWLRWVEGMDAPEKDTDFDLLNRGIPTCTFLTPDGCDQYAYDDFPPEL